MSDIGMIATTMKKTMTIKLMLTLNYLIISSLIISRFFVDGYMLLIFGLLLIPIIILHTISTTKGLRNYSKLTSQERLFEIVSLNLFAVFMFFQFEMDDRWNYMIIEVYIRKLFHTEYVEFSTLPIIITLISGIALISIDVYILIQIKKLKILSTNKSG